MTGLSSVVVGLPTGSVINQYVSVGDGPVSFNCQVLQDGAPLPLVGGVVPVITLKSGQTVQDSTGIQFNVNNGGIQQLNGPGPGQFVWVVPAIYLTEPVTLWYHGIVTGTGTTYTWVQGFFAVQAV